MCARESWIKKMPRQGTSFKRGFQKYGGRSRSTYSRSTAASRIQRTWRSRNTRPASARRIKAVIRSTLPTDYFQENYTLTPQSGVGGNVIRNCMVLPFSIANAAGQRTGDKVFWKGLTLKWSIHCARVYAAGNTPGKVRFGLIEARGTQIADNTVYLYNPTNDPNGVNDVDAIMNHAKVRVIFDRTVTMGDAQAYSQMGYRDHINVKTFTPCNSRRMFISNDPLTPTRVTDKNWYVFAVASGYTAGQIRISVESSFSFKDLA